MSLRRRDVEQWMRHRRLPEELGRYSVIIHCVRNKLTPYKINYPLLNRISCDVNFDY